MLGTGGNFGLRMHLLLIPLFSVIRFKLTSAVCVYGRNGHRLCSTPTKAVFRGLPFGSGMGCQRSYVSRTCCKPRSRFTTMEGITLPIAMGSLRIMCFKVKHGITCTPTFSRYGVTSWRVGTANTVTRLISVKVNQQLGITITRSMRPPSMSRTGLQVLRFGSMIWS